MRHRDFYIDADGFYGAYWPCDTKSNCAVITMLGDDAKDYMARCGVKWLKKSGVNVLTMSPDKKNYSHHNFPLERMEKAIKFLKSQGDVKIGIAGASTTGTLALMTASMFDDITLTVALTPSDFVWQGFMQGKRDGYTEWPVENESLFSYHGKPLAYMPFCYQHPQYGKVMKEESKKYNSLIASKKIFDDSEKAHPIQEDEYIKVENIKGRLLLIGAEDDVLWDTAKYIRRMERRLESHPHTCNVETKIYKHATHFVFPQSMIEMILPLGSNLLVSVAFKYSKPYSKECKDARIDIDRCLKNTIEQWRNE